jgi:catechol 2,3-dioxygenase-like lactoylglutathione lyase family enzyme
MLADMDAIATVAVKDLNVAKKFYESTLGLKPGPTQQQGVLGYKSGKSSVIVYQSRYAGTNKANAVTWAVGGEFDGIMKTLKGRGVVFEHYDDLPGLTRDGDVHSAGGFKVAWFKDPDGNILQIVSG